MADNVGSVVVSVKAEDETREGLGKVESSLKGFALKAASILSIGSLIKSSLSSYQVSEQANLKLELIQKRRLGLTQQEVELSKQMNLNLQKQGIISADILNASAATLSSFLNSKTAIQTLTPALADFLAATEGINATMQSAESSALAFARAIETGNIELLRRQGLSITQDEINTFKSLTTELDKVNFLSNLVNQNFGNINSQLAKTDIGKLKQMKNSFENLKTELGKSVLPTLNQVLQTVLKVTEAFGGLKNIVGTVLLVFGVFKATKVILEISKLIAAFSGLAVAKTAAQTGVGALAAIPAVIGAIAGGIAAVGAIAGAGVLFNSGNSSKSKVSEAPVLETNIIINKDEFGYTADIANGRNGGNLNNVSGF